MSGRGEREWPGEGEGEEGSEGGVSGRDGGERLRLSGEVY